MAVGAADLARFHLELGEDFSKMGRTELSMAQEEGHSSMEVPVVLELIIRVGRVLEPEALAVEEVLTVARAVEEVDIQEAVERAVQAIGVREVEVALSISTPQRLLLLRVDSQQVMDLYQSHI